MGWAAEDSGSGAAAAPGWAAELDWDSEEEGSGSEAAEDSGWVASAEAAGSGSAAAGSGSAEEAAVQAGMAAVEKAAHCSRSLTSRQCRYT